MAGDGALRVIPLGGCGEFGLNLTIYEHGGEILVVDCGLMFSDEEGRGVDRVWPDLEYLRAHRARVRGYVITHGHEDHCGALPHALRLAPAPVWATPYTLDLIRRRLAEDAVPAAELCPLEPGPPVPVGEAFSVEAVPVAHSVPGSVALALRCGAGLVLHSGDYKLAGPGLPPEGTDPARLQALGDEGVALLVGDSTGACEPGLCPPEAAVREALAAVLDAAPGRIWVAQFASHVERLATVAALAARFGRALALLGRGLREHADVAVRHGYLRLPPGLRVGAATLPARPARQGLGVVTGTQAEPGSALWALARNTHPELRLEPGDTVVRSARTIPGHERRVNRLTDRLWARGVTVVEPDGRHAVHVSGHGHREDLSRLIAWTRPAALLPVHGRVRMLAEHAALARARGVPQVHVPENGAVLRLTDQGLEQTGRVTAGRVRVTGPYVGGVRPAELRERRRLATAGVVVALVRVDPGSTARLGPPQLTARGLLRAEDGEPLLRRAEAALRTALAALPPAARQDPAQVADEVRRELRRFFRRTLGHKPVVIPQVVTPSGTPLAVS